MKNSKLIIIATLALFLLPLTSAISDLGSFKEGEPVELIQTCPDCTFNNISSITYPNGTTISIEKQMNKEGNTYTYQFNNTNILGTYKVNGVGDPSGLKGWNYEFSITPSGNEGDENTAFFIFIILLIFGITFTGFFGRNIPITILGGMAMIFLGIYLVNNGIIIFRDNITNYIAYLCIGIGGLTSLWAALEQLEVI